MPKGAETLYPRVVVLIERCCTPLNIRGINRHLKDKKIYTVYLIDNSLLRGKDN